MRLRPALIVAITLLGAGSDVTNAGEVEVSSSPVFIPPKALSSEAPVYPPTMLEFGVEGDVEVNFEVTETGRAEHPRVTRSTDAGFEDAALAAVRKWKFKPATQDGKPTRGHVVAPVAFRIDESEVWRSSLRIKADSDQSKLPPAFHYDQPAKVRRVALPVYPYAERVRQRAGKAAVRIVIGPDGAVKNTKINAASDPAFGLALAAAAATFHFDPARKAGQPVYHVTGYAQDFDIGEFPDDVAVRLAKLEREHPERIVAAETLTTRLKATAQPAPLFPVGEGFKPRRGDAVIGFLLDEDGFPRLERIVSASAPEFGYAAMQAVSLWRYEPPTENGQRVVVRVRLAFTFDAGVSSAASTKPQR